MNPVKLRFNKTAQIYIKKLKEHGCIHKYVFILLLHLLKLSGRSKVGFGVGDFFQHKRALTFSDTTQIFLL